MIVTRFVGPEYVGDAKETRPMRWSQRAGTALASGLAVVMAGCGGGDGDVAPRTGAGVAALIKGIDNPFFATMRDGIEATARRHGVRLRIEFAAGLQDTDGQASALESLIAQRPGCYVINPINGTNLLPPLTHLTAGARVVNIDSPVDSAAARALGVRISTYIGTDNVAAGRAGAGAMARLVAPGARVAVVGGIPGDAGSGARTRGFKLGAGRPLHGYAHRGGRLRAVAGEARRRRPSARGPRPRGHLRGQ